jgi:hypothetical protein
MPKDRQRCAFLRIVSHMLAFKVDTFACGRWAREMMQRPLPRVQSRSKAPPRPRGTVQVGRGRRAAAWAAVAWGGHPAPDKAPLNAN